MEQWITLAGRLILVGIVLCALIIFRVSRHVVKVLRVR
jgi:hypothetical protein